MSYPPLDFFTPLGVRCRSRVFCVFPHAPCSVAVPDAREFPVLGIGL